MRIDHDPGFDSGILQGLNVIGHELHELVSDGFGSVSAVADDGHSLQAVTDERRRGSAATG